MADFRLDWRGDELKRTSQENGAKIISEFALTVEGEAKKELRRGHGVLTGTLRRSIHTVLPGYDWSGDDVDNGKERGGVQVTPDPNDEKITVQVGSGLVYAMAIHQGWPLGYKKMKGSFVGYHFITNGQKKAKAILPSIIAKYKVKR